MYFPLLLRDSAFLSATGKRRPAYHALRQGLRSH